MLSLNEQLREVQLLRLRATFLYIASMGYCQERSFLIALGIVQRLSAEFATSLISTGFVSENKIKASYLKVKAVAP